MSDYRVVEVTGKKDLMKFIKFPDRLYKDCPQYVPALHSDQVHSLTSVSTLSYCTRKMWMAPIQWRTRIAIRCTLEKSSMLISSSKEIAARTRSEILGFMMQIHYIVPFAA